MLFRSDCELKSEVLYGSHYILIGEVESAKVAESGPALVYSNRSYGASVPLGAMHSSVREPREGQQVETVSIGCHSTLAPFLVSRIIEGYSHINPNVAIRVYEGTQEHLIHHLGVRDADMLLTYQEELPDWWTHSRLACVGGLRAAAAPVAAGDAPYTLDPFTVTGTQTSEKLITPLLTLPRHATLTAPRIAETVNLVDTEDAVKYLPSLFLRKRNNGDTQAVMATRTWGVSSGARSLIYADGVLLSALIANNNSIGGPRWGLVAPAEIESLDVMYGPYSAAYAGNSLGAVVEITTRLPDRREGSIEGTAAWQSFRLYGTDRTYAMAQTAVTYGDKAGPFSFWISANH